MKQLKQSEYFALALRQGEKLLKEINDKTDPKGEKYFEYKIIKKNEENGVISFKTSLIQVDFLKELCQKATVWYYKGKFLLFKSPKLPEGIEI